MTRWRNDLGELGEMELGQLTMQNYYIFQRNNGVPDKVMEQFILDCPQLAAVAEVLYKERVLEQ